jgi:hypothetical protein
MVYFHKGFNVLEMLSLFNSAPPGKVTAQYGSGVTPFPAFNSLAWISLTNIVPSIVFGSGSPPARSSLSLALMLGSF